MIKTKQGISLIVLVITIIVPYYEILKASKIGEFPPKNKIEKMRKQLNRKIDKVA